MLPSAYLIESLESRFGLVSVGSGGEEILVKCPFCHKRGLSEDKSGHLSLNFGRNKGHCVRCDQGISDVTDWLKKYHNMPFLTDVRKLGSSIRTLKEKMSNRRGSKVIEVTPQELEYPEGCHRMSLNKWGEDAYTKSLVDKNIRPEEVVQYDIHCCTSGRYEGYVIFPFVEDDVLVYWQGRAAFSDIMRKTNPSKNSAPLGKAHWLYRREFIKKGSKVYLVEGSLDHISAQRHLTKTYGEGHYATSIQGTALSFPAEGEHPLNSQFGQLADLEPSEVCVLFDPDAKKKAENLSSLLRMCGLNAYAGDLCGGDPNEAGEAEFLRATAKKTDIQKAMHRLSTLKPR